MKQNGIFIPSNNENNSITYTYKIVENNYSITYYDDSTIEIKDKDAKVIASFKRNENYMFFRGFFKFFSRDDQTIIMPSYSDNSVTYTYRYLKEGDNITCHMNGFIEIKDENGTLLSSFNRNDIRRNNMFCKNHHSKHGFNRYYHSENGNRHSKDGFNRHTNDFGKHHSENGFDRHMDEFGRYMDEFGKHMNEFGKSISSIFNDDFNKMDFKRNRNKHKWHFHPFS